MKWVLIVLATTTVTACATASPSTVSDAGLTDQWARCNQRGGILTPRIGSTIGSATHSCTSTGDAPDSMAMREVR